MIPYGRQTIEEDDIQAVVDVLRSDYLTTGPKIAEFEKLVADYVGAKYAVAISNGTSALHAACFAAAPAVQSKSTAVTMDLFLILFLPNRHSLSYAQSSVFAYLCDDQTESVRTPV